MSGAYVPPVGDMLTSLRDAAVASLLAYGTLAFDAVEAERIDTVPSGSMPRVLVFADEEGQAKSRGGTAPAFDMTGTLIVQCLVERAQRADAVADLDALIAQVKDCLFGDPAWTKLSGPIGSVATQRSFKMQGERIVGDGRVRITLSWIDKYPPRITTPLNTIDITIGPPLSPPGAAAPVPVAVNITLDL